MLLIVIITILLNYIHEALFYKLKVCVTLVVKIKSLTVSTINANTNFSCSKFMYYVKGQNQTNILKIF